MNSVVGLDGAIVDHGSHSHLHHFHVRSDLGSHAPGKTSTKETFRRWTHALSVDLASTWRTKLLSQKRSFGRDGPDVWWTRLACAGSVHHVRCVDQVPTELTFGMSTHLLVLFCLFVVQWSCCFILRLYLYLYLSQGDVVHASGAQQTSDHHALIDVLGSLLVDVVSTSFLSSLLPLMYNNAKRPKRISNVASPVVVIAIIQPSLAALPEEHRNYGKAVYLGIAFACNIGGMTVSHLRPKSPSTSP